MVVRTGSSDQSRYLFKQGGTMSDINYQDVINYIDQCDHTGMLDVISKRASSRRWYVKKYKTNKV